MEQENSTSKHVSVVIPFVWLFSGIVITVPKGPWGLLGISYLLTPASHFPQEEESQLS